MKKAVIYGRVSTEDKQQYDRQVYDLMEFAKKSNYKVVEQFTEKVSGTKAIDKRLEYTRMMEYFQNHSDVKLILVTELTRFGRLGTMTKLEIENLAKKGISIFFKDRGFYSLQENGEMNSDTMMIIGMLCDIAKKEIETLQHRIKSGLRYSAVNNGAKSGKYKPYGFKSVNKKLVVDEKEIKIVKEIFRLYKSGLGCSQIANHLNSQGIETRYNKMVGENTTKTKNGYVKKGIDFSWSSGTITTMLKNKLYKGERWHKDELVGKVEPTVDPTIFDQVQAIMNSKNNRPIRMIKNDNHLKSIIVCGVCGQSYYMHKRKDGKDAAYKCLSSKRKYEGKMEYCGSPSIGIDKLLDSLYIIASRVIITKLRTGKSTHQAEIESKIQVKQIELDNFKKEIKRFEKKLSTLYDHYNDSIIPKAVYLEKKSEFENAISKAQEQLNRSMIELKGLEDLKAKPIRDSYTKDTFLREIRNVINNVTVGKPTPNKSLERVFSDKDTLININVNAVSGEKFNYVLGRYSDKLHFIGGKSKVTFRMKGRDANTYDITYDLEQMMHKLVSKNKLLKNAVRNKELLNQVSSGKKVFINANALKEKFLAIRDGV